MKAELRFLKENMMKNFDMSRANHFGRESAIKVIANFEEATRDL